MPQPAAWNDLTYTWDDLIALWDADCTPTVLWNDTTATWDDLAVDWNGCDFRGAPVPSTVASPPGGRKTYDGTPSDETRRFWESEAQRLRVLRDDDELIAIL